MSASQTLQRVSQSDLAADIIAGVRARRVDSGPLWPAPYNEDTPESAWKFVRECRSYLETTGETLSMPDLDYLEAYAFLWHEVKECDTDNMLFTQKCRRMIISWEARCLELHQMGLARSDQLLVGEDLEAGAKHVWRLKHLYSDLRERHRNWRLPEAKDMRYEGERKLKSFALPNGSICNYANGQAGGIQGDGYKIITLEEPAQYRDLSNMVAQAKITTIGPTKSRKGTLVNLIANTPVMNSPAAYDFGKLKDGWEKVPARV